MPSKRSRRQAGALMRALMLPKRRRTRRTPVAPTKRVAGIGAGKTTSAARPATPAPARQTRAASKGGGRWLPGRHRGPSGSRSYFVYVPAGRRRNSPVPLLVALHGCSQSAAEFAAATRFNDLADRHGFVVAYPEQAAGSHQFRCWHWYESAHQQRGVGEPAIIAGIVADVMAATARWRIDPGRVYVAGLSAGGAMALVLAATYPDVFAAVGVHSAPAYRSAATARDALGALAGRAAVPPPATSGGASRPMPPTILFQGTADGTVRGRNGQRVAEQWLAFCTAHLADPKDRDRITRSRTSPGRTSDGRTYTTTRWYSARGRTMLEYWDVNGLGHAWSGGLAGGSYSDPRGPRASTAMWRFFADRRLPSP